MLIINNSLSWPLFPYLPMERYNKQTRETELGFLWDLKLINAVPDHNIFVVFKHNILFLSEFGCMNAAIAGIEREIYHSEEELLKAGWMVN